MMKMKTPFIGMPNECIIDLAQMTYDEHRSECTAMTKDIYGIGLNTQEKALFMYFKLKRHKVIACSAIINDGVLERLVKFSLAYAVKEKYRRRGMGEEVTQVAIEHFTTRINIKDVSRYYLVSYVALDNLASQRLSEKFFGPHVKEVCDDHTNERQFEYRMLIEKSPLNTLTQLGSLNEKI